MGSWGRVSQEGLIGAQDLGQTIRLYGVQGNMIVTDHGTCKLHTEVNMRGDGGHELGL